MSLRRHVAWVLVLGILAAVTLPVMVYFTGTATLGPYANGGLGDFVGDYFADLLGLRAGAWTLLLGPVALVVAWRVIVALAWPGQPAAGSGSPRGGRRADPGDRRDPTIGGLSRE